ncbi:MAG: hypothetical protein QOC87_1577 [Actinomycetota bacterium]|jgi:hypothetical protein|nr:hypothetical protein [Actinomycetota bacterium]
MTEEKIYSVAEATALLPYIAPALVELREKFEEAAKIRAAVAQAAVTNGGSSDRDGDRDKENRTMARVTELIERLEEWQVELRDIETGLIDFPSRMGDEQVWLCWRLGEPSVAYFHRRDEGFAARKPL